MKELFRDESYLKAYEATVTQIDERGVQLDQTLFYAHGGGQLGDHGFLQFQSGDSLSVTDTQKDKATGEHLHVIDAADTAKISVGDGLMLKFYWNVVRTTREEPSFIVPVDYMGW